MKLDNLILQITYPENSQQYSNILSHLMSHSPDFGTVAHSDDNMHITNNYLYNNDGSEINYSQKRKLGRSLSRLNDIISAQVAQEMFIDRVKDFKDYSGTPILESQNKFTLPVSFNYKTFKTLNTTKINADYTSAKYIGLLEYIMYSSDDLLEIFNCHIELSVVDTLINSKITNGFIDLTNSHNFCEDILLYIAKINNEIIDIDVAMKYFYNKPVALVAMAIDKGVNYVIHHGYSELKKTIIQNYHNTTSHRAGIHSVKIKTLFVPDANISKIAYNKLYEKAGLTKNDQDFLQWHAYMFDKPSLQDEFSTEFFVNIISKLMTGKNFSIGNWGTIQQIILSAALEEKLGVTDDISAYKKYIGH